MKKPTAQVLAVSPLLWPPDPNPSSLGTRHTAPSLIPYWELRLNSVPPAVSKLFGFLLPVARAQLSATAMPSHWRGTAQPNPPLLHPPLPPRPLLKVSLPAIISGLDLFQLCQYFGAPRGREASRGANIQGSAEAAPLEVLRLGWQKGTQVAEGFPS